MTLERFILYLLHLAICVAAIFLAAIFLASCTHYVEPNGGRLTQVGGYFCKNSQGEIFVNNIESFEDTTDVAETGLNWWGAAKMLDSNNAADVAKTKSADKVTTTGIVEDATTERLIDTNKTSIEALKLGVE